MNFLKIGKLFKSKTTIILVFSIISFFLFSDVSFAEDPATKGINQAIELLQGAVKLLASLLGIMTSFVSMFLHPSWVNGSIFGLDTQFKTVWILISNVVYFIFALILVAVAFMNIIGQGTDHYEIKQALPKLVVGVLIVPISWFFVQFILSISAILTVSVLSLPFDTFGEEKFFQDMSLSNTGAICTDYTMNLGSSGSTVAGFELGTGEMTAFSTGFLVCNKPLISINDYIKGKPGEPGVKDSIFGIITLYTYGVMDLNKIDKVTADMSGIVTIADLLVNKVIFDLIFFLIYFLLMIALFLALFTRGVWIWIYTMFSPVFGLLYFLGKAKEGYGEEKIGILGFIKLAMVPVLVGAALSFGLVFLFVVGHSIKSNSSIFCENEKNCINFAGIKLGIVGVSDQDSEDNLGIGGFLGNTIMKIMGLVVLWMSIMAALKSSEITNAVAKPIMEFGESVGSLAKGGLKYLPIMPAPGGLGMMSADTLHQVGSRISNIPSTKSSETAGKIAELFGGDKDKIGTENYLKNITNNDLDSAPLLNKKMDEVIPITNGKIMSLNNDKFKEIATKLSKENKYGLGNFYDKDTGFKLNFDTESDIEQFLSQLNNGLIKDSGYGFLSKLNGESKKATPITNYSEVSELIAGSKTKDTKTDGTEGEKIKPSENANPLKITPNANNGGEIKSGDKVVANYITNNNNNNIEIKNTEKGDFEINQDGNFNKGGIDTFAELLKDLGTKEERKKVLETMFAGITNIDRRNTLIANIISSIK